MLKFINEILLCFRPCFSRKAAFEWSAAIITGLMVRSDSLGITSIIRDLLLNPSLYNCMEHFFHADSWDWDDIFTKWTKTVSRYAPFKQISGRTVLIGDGVKRASDGRYIPCIKRWCRNRKVHPNQRLSTDTFWRRRSAGRKGFQIFLPPLFRFMARQEELTITKIISSRQIPFETEEIDLLIS